MKVVVTIAALDLQRGGPARSVPTLCRALMKQGVDLELVTIAESGRKSSDVEVNGFKAMIIETSATRYQPRSWSKQFKEALTKALMAKGEGRRAKEGIIYDVGLWLPSNHFAAQIAAQTQTPLVVSPRGMLSKTALGFSKWKKKIAWWLYQHRDLNSARVLHATSEKEAEEFRSLGLTQPIAIVANGVEVPAIPPRTEDREQTTRTVLFISRLHPIKGLPDLVQSWAKVKPKDWRVLIAGPDENNHRADLEKLAQSLGVRNDFEFVGPIDDDHKWELLHRSDLFVLPSYSESFGMAIAEALAAGVPVITTKATPWREIETHNCGWWVNTGVESITAALQSAIACDSQTLRAMGQRGRELVGKNYSWDSAAKKLFSVFEWVLGKGEKPTCVV
jgi:glycosyltransferase involved in cell wall biosynthesis